MKERNETDKSKKTAKVENFLALSFQISLLKSMASKEREEKPQNGRKLFAKDNI